jgi:trimeric autotransporter adhesin
LNLAETTVYFPASSRIKYRKASHNHMKKIIFFIAAFILIYSYSFSQVGIGTNTPNASAGLDVFASNKGFLLPRVALTGTGDITTIPSPATSLLIYNTATAGAGKTAVVPGFYFYNGLAWSPIISSGTSAVGTWSTLGNAGTTAANNFIGTTDSQPLKFRINNIPAGEIQLLNGNLSLGVYSMIDNISGDANTAIGTNSLHHNLSGDYNVALGIGTLFNNLSGYDNAAIGSSALVANTTGIKNVSLGSNSMYNNQSGSGNVAIGSGVMNYNLSGNSNIGIGKLAAYNNVSGSNIVAVGDSALYWNTMGFNVAIGSKALYANTIGVSNTALGSHSMFNNIEGSQNTAVGRISLFNNISGDQNSAVGFRSMNANQTGNRNVGMGFQSLFFNVAGNDNTAIGYVSLANNTANDNTAVGSEAMHENGAGYNGTAIGKKALYGNTTGHSNTAVGTNALAYNQSGSFNTAIGAEADIYGTNYVNATAIGAKAQSGCSNCLVLGSVTGYNGATAYTKVGIGTTSPQKALHVNPNGSGGISIGKDLVTGGYTALHMGISQESGGYSFLQSVKASGLTYGNLALNLNGGDVGIKTIPLALLHLKQNVDEYPITNGGIRIENWYNGSHWDFGMDGVRNLSFSYNGAAKFYFDDIDGEMYTVSDMRMKKDIKPVGNVLQEIMRLQAKTYHYIDNENNTRSSYGFIAQEVEEIFPGFVSTKGKDNLKAIGYQKLNVMAIKALQEQQQIIENQNKKIDALEVKLEQLIKLMSNH